MNQAWRDDQKMAAVQMRPLLAREFVGRGAIEQKQEFETLVRVPGHTAGDVAAEPADVNKHRQLDLVSINIDSFIFHARGATDGQYYPGPLK